MTEYVKIDPELITQAAAVHAELADELRRPLAVHADLLTAVESHGPIFAGFKSAMRDAVLPARYSDITDQIARNEAAAAVIAKAGADLSAIEESNAARQGSVEL